MPIPVNDRPCQAERALAECEDYEPSEFWQRLSDSAGHTITAPPPLLEIMLTPMESVAQEALACQFSDDSWALEATDAEGNVGLHLPRAHPDARLLSGYAKAIEHADLVLLVECRSCSGSGLHQGYAERVGIAVVCRECGGSGAQAQGYTPFVSRREVEGVERVLSHNPGIGLNDPTQGVDYGDWQRDPLAVVRPGSEVRDVTCPAWWYQGSRAQAVVDWPECQSAMRFRNCRLFPQKAKCWERFDLEGIGGEMSEQ